MLDAIHAMDGKCQGPNQNRPLPADTLVNSGSESKFICRNAATASSPTGILNDFAKK